MKDKMHLEKHVTYNLENELLACTQCGALQHLPKQGTVPQFAASAMAFAQTHKNCMPCKT
jgi:hypothetical protein